ncbi:polyprenyl diphosphate synthase [Heyndrickxia oleronia]|jgi:undecaprenyl diphosphate synthase|uniref:polyprenyl diphosphate synthase n=1 Tax=Heyndrickxia oleronia TaxID=38875 RepID=UPI00242C89FA|nr:polyprenyl diphosphate synthase [Heyndrickxia oleronia]MCI1590541.1 polyprenyl diphosphate synthase [Heyndrickxia oleronia]MCI1612579.1 polyprenyl diphosphate synthase [Heyndrickxia oleronia]MCI1743807.1 polyprenyl diphosphate synthase [Heyndrickxia oleronia]MCI1760518.1 polyprenyl diphosphate synthase [Heyndrickxia oleronia]
MQNVPTHIAIMMDGNGRWGEKRGLTRSQGHFAGSKTMENIIDASLELGVKILTLYAFSSENWTRPEEEVKYLMDLPVIYLNEKLPKFIQKDIRICVLGDINGLPIHTREAVKKAVDQTSNNSKLIVNFALNYGGRSEILSAIKSLINDINNSKIADSGITGDLIENYLYTKGQPEPDIVIRTGGEKRMSNFLLWQSSKSEWWFTDTLFPEFDSKQLLQAINEVKQRKDINIS